MYNPRHFIEHLVTYRSLYHHGPLVPHGSHDVEWIDGFVGLDEALGRLHQDQHARPPDARGAVHDGGLHHAWGENQRVRL